MTVTTLKYPKIITLLLSFVCLTSGISIAQSPSEIDSLINYVVKLPSDTAKVNELNKLCWELNSSDPKHAVEFGVEALNLADSLNYEKGKALAFNNLGVVYSIQGSYPKGLEYFLSALTIRERINDKKGAAQTANNVGIIYKNQKKYDFALDNYFRSLKIKEELNDSSGIARTYNNIGEVYQLQKKYDESLNYHKKSLALEEKLGYKRGIASSLSNIAEIYQNTGKPEDALEYHLKALAIEKEIGNKQGMGISLNNIALLYSLLGNPGEAIRSANEALEVFKESDNYDGRFSSYQTLSDIYAAQKNYPSAYNYLVKASALRDSIYNDEKAAEIVEAQSKYEIDKRDNEIVLLKKDKELDAVNLRMRTYLIFSFAVVIILLGIFVFHFYRSNKKLKAFTEEILSQREKLERLNQEKNSLMAIVAHDLKSPIAAIKNLSEITIADGGLDETQKETIELIGKISAEGAELITELLDLTHLEERGDSLSIEDFSLNQLLDEIRRSFHSSAQKKNITLQISCDGEIKISTDKYYVKLVISNLVSNAIKYSPHDTEVDVIAVMGEDSISITVKDQGLGFSDDDKKKIFTRFAKLSARPTGGESSNGLGLSIVKMLVDRLKGEIMVESKKNKGSNFIILLPISAYTN